MITVSIITNVSSSFTPVLSLSVLMFLLLLLFYNTAVVIADVNGFAIIFAVVMVAVVVMAAEVKAVCFYVRGGGGGGGGARGGRGEGVAYKKSFTICLSSKQFPRDYRTYMTVNLNKHPTHHIHS